VTAAHDIPVVVVIDDDETFVEMLTWWLSRRGFAAIACTTDTAAREAIAAHDVAALVCDIELGAGTIGTRLVAELRRQAGRDVPCVFVSGYRAEFVQVDARRDRFLQKPFDLSALSDVLADCLAER
jgi:DNA-binding response OmpR family regulator